MALGIKIIIYFKSIKQLYLRKEQNVCNEMHIQSLRIYISLS